MAEKVPSTSHFIQSPFVEIKDNAYRMLLHKYGTHITYVPVMSSSQIIKEESFRDCSHSNTIVQIKADDEESLVKAAEILKHKGVFSVDITSDVFSDELLHYIKVTTDKVAISVACKLNINNKGIDKIVNMAEQLHMAGCKILLLHCHSDVHSLSILCREHWELIKKIRDLISFEFLVVEMECSSLKEAQQFFEYTGIQQIAVSEPLLWNPSFFSSNRVSTTQMIKDYIVLCQTWCTQLHTAKECILKFGGYFLKRFSGIRESIESATSFDGVTAAVESMNQEMSKLSKKQVKALEKLQQKKEKYRMKKLKRKNLQDLLHPRDGQNSSQSTDNHRSKRLLKQDQKERIAKALISGQRIAIDLSLDKHMSDKEIGKVAGQVRRLYGSNLRSSQPFHLYLTGLVKDGRIYRECVRQNSGFDDYSVEICQERVSQLFDPQSVVYLSPDSPNLLNQLDENNIYVIGGLVDHQVIKGVSLSNAGASQIATARLPIDEHMERALSGNYSYSRVLTINQVFDILLKYHETKDWKQALEIGVPRRKGFQSRKKLSISNDMKEAAESEG